jgi:hypothetical protein
MSIDQSPLSGFNVFAFNRTGHSLLQNQVDVAPVFVASPDCQLAARVHQANQPQTLRCELQAAEFIEGYQSKPLRWQTLPLYVFLPALTLQL